MHRSRAALLTVILVACATEGPPADSPVAEPHPSDPSTVEPALTPALTPTPSELTAETPPNLRLELVAGGLDLPSGLALDANGMLYVNETRSGLVRVISRDGTLMPEPFLDLSDRIRGDGERGLLGFALHPEYQSNGRIFVHYTRNIDGAIVVAEFARRPGGSGESADSSSERVLLVVEHPSAYHNGGQLAFGPDGYLYIGLGDGGSPGDIEGNAQSPDVLLGKILRIDVDVPPAPGRSYEIPADNPFAAGGGAPELYVLGVRNPWRFSFDAVTDALWVGDVGEGALEEVTRLEPGAAAGANLGWSVMEGSVCYNLVPCDTAAFVAPLTEYGRDRGCAVIGGVVARGDAIPGLTGWYVFADYCEGTIFGVEADAAASAGQPIEPHTLLETGMPVTAIAQDAEGTIYLTNILEGTVYRLTADPSN